MFKLAILGCLCVAMLAKAQNGPPTPPSGPQPQPFEHSRVARQTMPGGQLPMDFMQNMQGGQPGNLGMQGLGNIPDPTAVMAKAQEVGRQFMSGRRRRQEPSTTPPARVV